MSLFSTANPAVSKVRGAKIIAALERGLDPAISPFEFGGLRGTPLGIQQISGLQAVYDPGNLVVEDGQQHRYEMPAILREVLEDYIRELSPVPPQERGR